MYKNKDFVSIQELKRRIAEENKPKSIEEQVSNHKLNQIDLALANSNNANFKLIHPLLIKGYKMPSIKYSDTILQVNGLDVETEYQTGKPKLLGFYHPDSKTYAKLYNPTLELFYQKLKGLVNNSAVVNLVSWGTLDIQAIIRLFNPEESERKLISRGISANVKNGEIIGNPPVIRTISETEAFYISHYISGRSLKLGLLINEHEYIVWIFNCSQFYEGKISNNSKALNLPWKDFPKETHLIDWSRYDSQPLYRKLVDASNEQDARRVYDLTINLQQRFYDVFEAYPTLLVSTGSLTDSAVSKMLSKNEEDYEANSFKWLANNIWSKTNSEEDIKELESLASESYSAGYVDQFAVGYFQTAFTADIASAYPDKIRRLPDLRYSYLVRGKNALESDIQRIKRNGHYIETAFIRGMAHIPESLKYHPITIKTFNRENVRPTGDFKCAYTLEEREYCIKYGAKFEQEEYVILALTTRKQATIAQVSQRLGEQRNQLLAELKETKNEDRKILLNGMQYLVKVVDNSIYGKTVMTIEVVENIDGKPEITGYLAGDRFNMVYGSLITARTRLQLALACTAIARNGGTPIMTMTDSIYWDGSPTDLPDEDIRPIKTTGYFEKVETIHDFYIIKTGQYEYRNPSKIKDGKSWFYKLRGLPIDFETLTGVSSFYRHIIKSSIPSLKQYAHPKDIKISLNTRRLVSIGSHDLEHLSMVQEGETDLKPFVLSSKQQEHFLFDWHKAIDGHVWLSIPVADGITSNAYPMEYMKSVFSNSVRERKEKDKQKDNEDSAKRYAKMELEKKAFILTASMQTKKRLDYARGSRMRWEELEKFFGVTRQDVEAFNKLQKEFVERVKKS